MIRFISDQKEWKGAPINGVRHPPSIGTLWTDSELKKIGLERFTPPKVPAVPVDPLTRPLSRRQLRLGLLSMGITEAQVLNAIEQESDSVKREGALIEWQDAHEYHFEHPLVGQLLGVMGLDEDQAKATWIVMTERAD